MGALARRILAYLLVLALVTGAASVAGHYLLASGYAGVSDEATIRTGASTYGSFLREVVQAIVRLLAIETLLLWLATSGLVALVAPWRWWAWLPVLSVLVLSSFVGSVAHRYPGLLLPIVSAGGAGPIWLGTARFAWPVLLVGSAAGWLRVLVVSATHRDRLIALAGLLLVGLWIFEMEADGSEAARSGRPPAATGRRALPNVLLIGVDSLRPDKIDERSAPVLAKLVGESIYFPNTLVTLPRTAPSWLSMLTSLPPLGHGIETMFPGERRTDRSTLAMPAHLASLGYATLVASEYAGEFFGRVRLGFDDVVVPRVELREMLGQGLLGRHPLAMALAGLLYTTGHSTALSPPLPNLLRGLASFSHPSVLASDLYRFLQQPAPGSPASGKKPWFALLFYSQPHFPYTSSSRYYERYAVPDCDPALRFGKDVTRGEVRTAADRRQIDGLYRAALAETDGAIGELLEKLRSSGELDDTIVILTADHGEALYECEDCVGHGDNLRAMSTLKVPLAFLLPRARFPAASPGRITDHVSELDVYPTVLGLLGLPVPVVQEGIALVSRDGSPVPLPRDRTFFAETGEWLWPTLAVPRDRIEYPPITRLAKLENDRIVIEERYLPVVRAAKHRAAIRPPYKLVYRPSPRGIAWALYDIEKDPFDERDIASDHPPEAAELKAALTRSVLRYSYMLGTGEYFLTRPAPPPEEYY